MNRPPSIPIRKYQELYQELKQKHTLRYKMEDQSKNRCLKMRSGSSPRTRNVYRLGNHLLRLPKQCRIKQSRRNYYKAINKARNYTTNEIELLGDLWALEHFKQCLLGHQFTVQADHRPLLSILKERTIKIHQSRLIRWYDRLIPLHFNIEHIPGTTMGLTDYMSSAPPNQPNRQAHTTKIL